MRKQVLELMESVTPVNKSMKDEIQAHLDNLTKPIGSLGRLEDCAMQYSMAIGTMDVKPLKKLIAVFAGDHGVVEEGISAYPQEVTVQMLKNFSEGGAAINVMAEHEGIELKIVDVGVAQQCKFPGVEDRNVVRGTANIAKEPAMSLEEAEKAILVGATLALDAVDAGFNLLGTGDMGIGNTTPSSALFAAFLNLPAEEVVGRGTGLNDDGLNRKIKAVEKALAKNKNLLDHPLTTLQALGGAEIAALTGYILASASRKVPVVVDGFISCAAALTAIKMNKNVRDYLFFSHKSADAGMQAVVEHTDFNPMLDLGMRLGEGTGATLGMNLVEAGLKVMTEMASFADAGVSENNVGK